MSDVLDGVRDYLASGGLFNPELMDHQRTRDLIIECRDEIERLRGELDVAALEVTRLEKLAERDDAKEIERLRGFASWILEAYDTDEWPAQKDIVAGAREALGDE
jgi:hypothetical protein